ncbi:MAG: amino acid permease [Candidatus Bathyarchaeota archaeon]|nr:amino acid permease [Candidatus Bathyarchaeum tardum]
MLKRSLDLFGATFYGVGIILGAGIYVLIGSAVGLAGNSVWMSFVIGAVISSFTGLSYAELSTMFPKAAAEFIFVKNAFKNELLAFLTGWLIIFSGIVSIATVSLGFSSYFNALFDFSKVLTAVFLVVLLSVLNFVGIKQSSRVNILFTAIEVSGLLLVIILGFGQFGQVNYLEVPNVSGVFAAAALVFFAYLGFENVVNIAEETKNPSKTIPRALIISIIITTVFYVLVALAVVNLASWETLGGVDAPLAYAVSTVLGSNGFTLLSYVALFATANTVLIGLIVGSRMIYGMAKDTAFPVLLSKIHQKTRTPWVAILCMMLFSSIFILLENIDLVANLTSLGVFFTFALVNLSVIVLRYKKPNVKRPFKVPLKIGSFPVVPFLGLLSCLLMVTQFNFNVILAGSVVLGLGSLFFFLYQKS